jgi:predicted phosphoribosyltransferase
MKKRTSFPNRTTAGQVLAKELTPYANRDDVIVLGLPRGGVPVAYEIATALHLPLDVFIVRKLGVPGHEELAMGAIATGDVQVLNQSVIDDLNIPAATVEATSRAEHKEILRRERVYRGDSGPIDVTGKVVILVDDGIATGATIRAALKALDKLNPEYLIVAVPVTEQTIGARLVLMADEVITLLQPDVFDAVGAYYDEFDQTTDEEVSYLIAQHRKNFLSKKRE